ncbi:MULTISPECIES: ParB/Srx family N-terminal domain-containing protein [Psychrilyobacter]|uniref:ParB/Sulfiredoxin domain-containing protein n=1 Tax=Psychrilyobacter piezotolerans TaxID=2293438 RepID=A0ABX9KJ04_9FUSO|nr:MULTISPECIES: ParB/Srx family N-terminal domain-containing protein [Psychrilyobacter]MCS5421723.1 ParB N-terminal domain-containing protein [Psychrilyobacter sp. S5]NDI77158.1 hypothetical protein [Psychrilyobacter piezotolerans]RDE64150.1 hypothetical protein DV867_04265 [Psychrilyobacter sp. S5]REI42242.1 hypothetical protein DYH56_04265 [Psychrilyobacter piezotolerans]
MGKNIVIEIEKIILDSKNPRLQTIYNTKEKTLQELIQTQGEKLYNLALSISKNGLSPIENIAVIPENGKYVVIEGNRRIAAIMILKDPKLLETTDRRLYERILKIKNKTYPKNISAVSFDTVESAAEWISLKHTGENGGAGIVEWKPENKRLFDARVGNEETLSSKVIKCFLETTKFNENFKNRLGRLKWSVLDRVLSDPDMRDFFNIIGKKGSYNVENLNLEKFEKFIYDQVIRNPKADEVRNKNDRIDYIDKILDINPEPTFIKSNIEVKKAKRHNKKDYNFNDENAEIINEKEKKRKQVKEMSASRNRTKLIPLETKLVIKNQKLNSLYKELKKCKLQEYPLLVNCSFRIFLELTLDYYIETNNVPKHKTLLGKLEKVLEDLLKKEYINKNYKKTVYTKASSERSILSIGSLNAVVHSAQILDHGDLKLAWDVYENLFKKIYEKN